MSTTALVNRYRHQHKAVEPATDGDVSMDEMLQLIESERKMRVSAEMKLVEANHLLEKTKGEAALLLANAKDEKPSLSTLLGPSTRKTWQRKSLMWLRRNLLSLTSFSTRQRARLAFFFTSS